MEAHWIRDCQTPLDFVSKSQEHTTSHLEQYVRILLLLAFKHSESNIRYELWEIPKGLLLEINQLTATSFTPKSEVGSSKADIFVGG